MAIPPRLVAFAIAIAPGVAQVPAHATLLNPATFQLAPTLLQDGDIVHAFAIGSPSGVLHARSLDGGRTWPLREQPLGPFLVSWSSNNPQAAVPVAARPGELLVVVDESTQGPLLLRSTDAGTTWAAPIPIAATVAGLARRFPALWCDGATCVAVWTNDRPTGRVWTNRSLDGGTTWQATDTRLDLGVTLPTSVAVGPIDVLGAGATVHAFWSQGWTHYQRSLDGGATWLAQAQTLPAAGGMPLQHLVDTALAGSIVFAVDDQGQMVRSGDGGTTWAHVTNTGVAKVHEVAIDGNQVVVAGWNGQTTNAVFLVTTSLDGGLTWQNAPLALPSPSTVVLMHAIARSGQLFVHIEVPGYAGDAIRSVDGGNSWHLISGPVGGGFDVGERRTIHVANEPIAFPQLPQFHVYVGMGSSVRGSATPGSGGAAPNLTSVGLPVRGASTTLQVSAALGGMPGLLGLSFAPPATVPLGSATIHLSSLDVAIAFLATGAVGNPAAGTFALPIAVPPGTSLVGASLVAQALVLDGAAVDGFTVTNALELWLR